MFKKILKGFVAGVIAYLLFVVIAPLVHHFDGDCGIFASSPCSYPEYYFESILWFLFVFGIVFLPIFTIVTSIASYFIYKHGKSFYWIYLICLILIAGSLCFLAL